MPAMGTSVYREVSSVSGFRHLIFVEWNKLYHAEAKIWCEEIFGPDDPDGKWFSVTNMFAFQSEDDAFIFRMRWC